MKKKNRENIYFSEEGQIGIDYSIYSHTDDGII